MELLHKKTLQLELQQPPEQQQQDALSAAPERITAMGRAIMVLTDDVKTFRTGPSFA